MSKTLSDLKKKLRSTYEVNIRIFHFSLKVGFPLIHFAYQSLVKIRKNKTYPKFFHLIGENVVTDDHLPKQA